MVVGLSTKNIALVQKGQKEMHSHSKGSFLQDKRKGWGNPLYFLKVLED